MVAHLHTVLRLNQKATYNSAWLEWDIQVRMDMAALEDRTWTSGDPWQYVARLLGPTPKKERIENDQVGETATDGGWTGTTAKENQK